VCGVHSIKSGPSGEGRNAPLRKTQGPPTAGVQAAGPDGNLPAAGNRNGTSLNNAGSNGNYWSSSLNTDNPNNAYNVNFNSDNVDWNNNNRYNGQSVRPVSECTGMRGAPLPFDNFYSGTSPQKLLLDLYRAWKAARRHKRRKGYQLTFERNAEAELVRLRDAILARTWRPGVSSCFIIHDPKMREVFAAQFRDRVVHHLLYDYIAPVLEAGFIEDSYSCIKDRGTHYGIERLFEKIRTVSCNWTRPCYILKLDIEGYFMHIGRARLLEICLRSLEPHRAGMDFSLVEYLLRVIILDNPVTHCRRIGPVSEWEKLPDSKSLFRSPEGCGLPIGNLTSQLFSNVYMNEFDQYMVGMLGAGRYGRYVDDAYVVVESPAQLRALVPVAESFLKQRLGLTLSKRKIAVYSASRGVEFLGAYLKPWRKYLSGKTLRHMERHFSELPGLPRKRAALKVNSLLGLTVHYRAYHIRKRWLDGPLHFLLHDGTFTSGIKTYQLREVSR